MKCLQTTQDGYETPVYLNSNAQAELQYWLQNLETVNGCAITPPPPPPAPDLYIISDAFKSG